MVLLVGPCFFADSPCNYLWSALRGEDLCLVGQAGAWGVEAWVLKKSPIFILNNFLSFNLKNGTWFPPSSFCGELDSLATASGDAYKTSVQRFSTFCKVLNFSLVSWTLNNWQNLNWQRGLLEALPPLIFLQQAIKFQEMIHIKSRSRQEDLSQTASVKFCQLVQKRRAHLTSGQFWHLSCPCIRVPCSLPTKPRSWRNLFRWRDFVATLKVITLATRLMILDNVRLL